MGTFHFALERSDGWHPDEYISIFDPNGIGSDRLLVASKTLACAQRETFFMKWAGHFGLSRRRANHAARQNHLHPVRAHVLAGIPFAAAGKIKDCYLLSAITHTSAAILWKIRDKGSTKPCYQFNLRRWKSSAVVLSIDG
jgi:hypothetical protein